MLKGIKKFVGELRESDDVRKKRWTVILSAVTMAVVAILWLSNLNSSFKDASFAGDGNNAAETTGKFWPVMKNGAAIVYGNIADFVVKNMAQKKEINIKNELNFQSSEMPKVTPRKIE